VFTVSGGGTFATATYYDYDTTNLLVRRVKTLTSKGDTLYTNYTYPQDYAGQAIYDSMTNRHIWAKGIEKSVYLGVKLLSREKRNYDFFNFNIAGIKSTDLQKGNQATENRFSIHGYDQHENLLEQSKFNDVHTAYLYDYASQYPVATIANADSASVAYSSFEADGKGRWAVSSELRSDTAITGTKSYDLANGNLSMGGLSSGKIYRLSYWSRNGAKTISGGTGSGRTGRTANGWTYYEMDFTATSSSLTISGSGLIDEVRFCPQAAQMTTYTYIPLVGISSISDINGDITYYEYDGFNRLRIVKDVQGNILKSHQYNYANTISQ
jgi:hypothetical protein